MRIIFLCFFLFFLNFQVSAQIDTLALKPQKTLFKQSILPMSLVGASLISWNAGLDSDIHKFRNKRYSSFSNPSDDISQFIPMGATYILPIVGLKPKNDVWNRTVLIGKSAFVTMAFVGAGKYLINKDRPVSAQPAYPSGHTSMAFTSAEIFYQEYKDSRPILAHVGYLFAAKVGVMRMLNNKHWFSDVLAGAAVGIFSTRLVYATHRHRWGKWFRFKNKDLTIIPDPVNKGLFLSYRF
jgi:membrane-associated phospholipid phosphatase